MKPVLRAILFAHRKFLEGNGGVCADLRGVNLSKVNFSGQDLRRANLSRCNFEGADLRKALFDHANLSGVNFHRALIKGASFREAVLARSFLAFVDFDGVDFTGAEFRGADLRGANWNGSVIAQDGDKKLQALFRIVPEGDIIGWKKLRAGLIAKLLIPKEAKRSNGFGRRCRAEFAHVLYIVDEHGRQIKTGVSKRDEKLFYKTGEKVEPSGYDEDWKKECSEGINFFVTLEEAEMY